MLYSEQDIIEHKEDDFILERTKEINLKLNDVNKILNRVGEIRTKLMVDIPMSMPIMKFPVRLINKPGCYGAINGKTLFINHTNWAPLPNNQAAGVIYHEWMHVALLHLFRMVNKHAKVFNFAADFFINYHIKNDLRESQIALAPGMLYDTYYSSDNWTVERIYHDLMAEVEKRKALFDQDITDTKLKENILPSSDSNSNTTRYCNREQAIRILAFEEFCDWVMSNDMLPCPIDEKVDTKELIREIIKAGELHKKSRGSLPRFFEMHINNLRKAKVPWDRVFHDLFLELVVGSEDRSFAKPKRWALSQNLYLPSEVGSKKQDVVLIIDSSGSMYNEHIFQRFIGELKKIMEYVNTLTLISADAQVHEKVKINSIQDIIGQHKKFRFLGGGGTDFRPALAQAAKITHDICIYYTDGQGIFGNKPPSMNNILWVLIEDCAVKPPFGKYILALE